MLRLLAFKEDTKMGFETRFEEGKLMSFEIRLVEEVDGL